MKINENLIAITGKNGIGKDKVGDIIQFYLQQQNGISPVRTYDEACIFYNNSKYKSLKRGLSGYEIKKFAEIPRKCYELITGVDFHALNREEKEIEREMFIKFCEGEKELFGKYIWVNSLFSHFNDLNDKRSSKWIITDLRNSQEESRINDYNGLKVFIAEDENDSTDINFHYKIVNDGSIEDLVEKVGIMLKSFKIIK